MTTYNTGNPLGSSAAKDLYDNAQNLDFALNSITQTLWGDRFGRKRKTWYGIEKFAQDAISSFGYITLDSFEDGAINAAFYNDSTCSGLSSWFVNFLILLLFLISSAKLSIILYLDDKLFEFRQN